MNAPTPPGSIDPNQAEPVQAQQTGPGIIGATPNNDTQEQRDAKHQQQGADDAFFMDFDELVKEIKTIKSDVADETIKALESIFKSINDNSNGKLAIPRVADNAAVKNAHIALSLVASVQPNAAGKGDFTSATGNGVINASKQGIIFHAVEKKPFTQADAENIVKLALHNRDLLPPNKIQLTGTKEEQALIREELGKANALLPEKMRFIVEEPSEKKRFLGIGGAKKTYVPVSTATFLDIPAEPAEASAPATHEEAAPAADAVVQPEAAVAQPEAAAEATTVAPQAAEPAHNLNDAAAFADLNDGGVTPPDASAHSVAGETPAPTAQSDAQEQVVVQEPATAAATDDADVKKEQLEKLQAILDSADRESSAQNLIVGKTEDGQTVYQAKFPDVDAPEKSGPVVRFTLPEDGPREIISVLGNDVYKAYDSGKKVIAPQEDKPVSDAAKSFDTASAGEPPAISQDDPNFIGPRKPPENGPQASAP